MEGDSWLRISMTDLENYPHFWCFWDYRVDSSLRIGMTTALEAMRGGEKVGRSPPFLPLSPHT